MSNFYCGRFVVLRASIFIFWILGVLVGLYIAIAAPAVSFSGMQGFEFQPLSIVSRFAVLFFSFLISVIFTYYKNSFLLVLTVFIKAFLLAYTWRWFNIAFRDAGWLVSCLLMFFDICTVPVLLYSWLRCFAGDMQMPARYFIFQTLYAITIFCIDMFLVSPFALPLFYQV